MMIRAACHRGGVTRRRLAAMTITQQQQQQSQLQHAPPVQCHLMMVTCSNGNINSNSNSSCIRMFSAQPLEEKEDPMEIPSNLRFDLKSSFAPKQKPLLVAVPNPSPSNSDEDEKEETDDRDIENVEDDFDDDDDEDIEINEPQYVVPLPDRLRADIRHGLDGSVSGSLWLDASVFGIDPVRIDLIKQNVDYIRNKIRGRRKAKSKTIGEVSGSGRKVRQQKGSGMARAGHSRPAHWRGGAKAHGPKNVTDYGKVKMNKKAKRLAMASVLSQKLKEGNFILVDNLQLESHKTGPWSSLLESAYGIGKDGYSALILDHYYEPEQNKGEGDAYNASYNGVPINLWVASGNIYKVKVANQRFCNVYDILKRDKLIMTLSALEQIESRWKS